MYKQASASAAISFLLKCFEIRRWSFVPLVIIKVELLILRASQRNVAEDPTVVLHADTHAHTDMDTDMDMDT